MKRFKVIVELPGTNYFEIVSYNCDTDVQAWDFAIEKARKLGPSGRVRSVSAWKENEESDLTT
jgi:hypothetical protein